MKHKLSLFIISVCMFIFGLWATIVSPPNASARGDYANAAYQAPITIYAIQDTYVTSLQENKSWGTEPTIWVGYNKNQGLGIQRSLLKFDLSEIPPNSTINSAELVLYLSATTSNDSDMSVTVSRLNGEWDEGITWAASFGNNPLIKEIERSSTQKIPAVPDTEHKWVITSLVQKWTNESGRPDNLALLIEGNEMASQHERGFWSKDCGSKCTKSQQPHLLINYSLPPTPTPIPTSTPGIVVNLSYVPSRAGTTILPNAPITFTVSYTAVNKALEKVNISTIITGDVNITDSGSGQAKDQTIVWNVGQMDANDSDQQQFKLTRKPAVEITDGEIEAGDTQGLTRTFLANLSDIDPVKTCYYWNFGDGKSAQSLNAPAIIHKYSKPGDYKVTLTASQEPSFYATASIDVSVSDNAVHETVNHSDTFTGSPQDLPCTLLDVYPPILVHAFASWEDGGNSRISKGNLMIIDPKSLLNLPLIAHVGQFPKANPSH
ncbi:MAG: DNRLRE domain-containing protein [Caldilineaceae bacterium]